MYVTSLSLSTGLGVGSSVLATSPVRTRTPAVLGGLFFPPGVFCTEGLGCARGESPLTCARLCFLKGRVSPPHEAGNNLSLSLSLSRPKSTSCYTLNCLRCRSSWRPRSSRGQAGRACPQDRRGATTYTKCQSLTVTCA